MAIIRKIKKILVSYNKNSNGLENLGGTGEIHNISDDDGSLESIYCEEIYNQHCGCFAPPGGRCYECGAVSCVNCHQHCGGKENRTSLGCSKPLCREHCRYLLLPDGSSVPFCKRCYGVIARKKCRRKITRIMLFPFIDEGNNER